MAHSPVATQANTGSANWPDLSIDRRVASQAFEELGDSVSLSKLLERAQQIKDEMLARGGQ